MGRKKRWLEVSSVFINQLISGLSGLVLLKLLTSYLSPVSYGYYALMMSVVSLALSLPFNGFGQGVLRFIPKHNESRGEYVSYVMSCSNFTLFLLVFYLGVSFLFSFFLHGVWKNVVLSLYIYFASQVIYGQTLNFYNGNRRRGKALLLSLFALVFKAGFLVAFLSGSTANNVKYTFELLCLANVLTVAITIGSDWRWLFQEKWRVSYGYVKPIVKFAMPLVVMSGFAWFRSMASRWYLDFFADKFAVASFSILSTLSMMLPTALQSFLVSYFSPIFYRNYDLGARKALKQLNKLVMVFFVFILVTSLAMWLYSDWVIVLFSSKKYIESGWMLGPMYAAFSMYILVSFFVTLKFFGEKKPGKLVMPNIIVNVLALFSGMLMAWKFGLTGVFVNFILMYLILGCVLYKLSRS